MKKVIQFEDHSTHDAVIDAATAMARLIDSNATRPVPLTSIHRSRTRMGVADCPGCSGCDELKSQIEAIIDDMATFHQLTDLILEAAYMRSKTDAYIELGDSVGVRASMEGTRVFDGLARVLSHLIAGGGGATKGRN